jgi:hypothetical protein
MERGIAVVGLAVAGLDHVAGQDQRGFFEERVDVGGVRVGHQLHVGGFDALPAGDRRAVEGMARNELVFVKVRDRHGGVLLLATGIGETEVNELDFVFLHHLHHVCDGLGHQQNAPPAEPREKDGGSAGLAPTPSWATP